MGKYVGFGNSAAHEMPMRPDQVHYLDQCNLHDTFCTRNMSTRFSEYVNACQRSPNTTPHIDVMRELILNDSLKLEQLRSAEVAVGQLGWVTDVTAEPAFSISRTRPLHVLRILSRGGCCFKSDGHRTSRVVPSLQTGRLRLSWDSDLVTKYWMGKIKKENHWDWNGLQSEQEQ